jgi:hypothetical protein
MVTALKRCEEAGCMDVQDTVTGRMMQTGEIH